MVHGLHRCLFALAVVLLLSGPGLCARGNRDKYDHEADDGVIADPPSGESRSSSLRGRSSARKEEPVDETVHEHDSEPERGLPPKGYNVCTKYKNYTLKKRLTRMVEKIEKKSRFCLSNMKFTCYYNQTVSKPVVTVKIIHKRKPIHECCRGYVAVPARGGYLTCEPASKYRN